MRNKKQLENGPGWKRRQDQVRKEMRRLFLQKVAFIALGVLVLGFFGWMMARGFAPHPKSKKKGPISYALARVDEMTPATMNGKPAMTVRFRAGKIVMEKTIDQKSAESIKRDQDYRLSFRTDPYTGEKELVDWRLIEGAKVK